MISDVLNPSDYAVHRFWDPISLAVFNTPFITDKWAIQKIFKALGKSLLDGFTPYLMDAPLSDIFNPNIDIEYGHRLKSITEKR